MENNDKFLPGCFIAIEVIVVAVISIILGLNGIDSTFLIMLISFGVAIVLFLIFLFIGNTFEKIERKKAAKIQRQKDEEEREKIIAGIETVEYNLLKKIAIKENNNYEEKCLIEAFNNYIPNKNEFLKIEQYNHFVRNQRNRLNKLNEKLGYLNGTDLDKLPQSISNPYQHDSKKVCVTKNFDKLYNYYSQNKHWDDFAEKISKTKLYEGPKLFCDVVDGKFADFFSGYDFKAIRINDDNYLFFFPCYIINLNNNSLKVITYRDMSVTETFTEKRCKDRDWRNFVRSELVRENDELKTYYINKVPQIQFKWDKNKISFTCELAYSFISHYNSYLKYVYSKTNADFFQKTFSVDEEKQRQMLLRERAEFIDLCKEPSKYSLLDYPDVFEKYNNSEETKLNKAFYDFITLKNEILKIKQFNKFIEDSKSKLQALNIELGYSGDKDIDKLPEPKKSITLKSKGYLTTNFVQLYDYFSSKKEWKNFISKAQKCKCAENKNLIHTAVEGLYKDFFENYGINVISLDDNNHLLLFPCYIVYIQKSMVMEVIPYDKLKISIEFVDKKSKTKNTTNGKTIAQEYTHQNLDGSPNRRYKSNPIIYTVRYFSLRISWGSHKRSVSCKDAELFLELFNDYAKTFKDELNAYVFKCGFGIDDIDLEKVISDYKEKEKKEKAKIKKQAEIAEKKRLQEEQAKEEEERQKKLAIIQRQKERNEEMLRKKELERNAMKLFGEDITDDCEDNFDSNSELSTNTQTAVAFSVLSECLITNNVFKVELRQEIDTTEQEYCIVFVDSNKTPISNKRSIKKVPVGEKIVTGITLLSNIDFTTMKKCFMQIEANGEIIAEIPFKMNIAFYSDF